VSILNRLHPNPKRQSSDHHRQIPAFWPLSGSIFAGSLNISSEKELGDTFVQPLNFTRGVLIINNQIVGRYNQVLGPQLRLYVPTIFLTVGLNIIVLIELDSLWLNETMVGSPNPEGVFYPLLFDHQMHWLTSRERSLY
ncbi:hypothetical protein AHF37_10886, partial [Paragonimus kellicotti]